MRFSTYRFTLNMHTHHSQASVSVFRGDTAVRLLITIVDGDIPFDIRDGYTAILSGTKADGTKLWDRCVIVGNTIQYDFNEQTASCTGVTNCEVTLYDEDGGIMTAPKFIIVVDEREVGYTDIVSSDHIDPFDPDKLVAIYNAEEERVEAEKARVEAYENLATFREYTETHLFDHDERLEVHDIAIAELKKYTKITPTLNSGVSGTLEVRYNAYAVHIDGKVKFTSELKYGVDYTIATVDIPSELKPYVRSRYSIGYYQHAPLCVKFDTDGVLTMRVLGNFTVPANSSLSVQLSYVVEYPEDTVG